MSSRVSGLVPQEAWSRMARFEPVSELNGPESIRQVGGSFVSDESDRTRLIGDLSRLIREPEIPERARTAGLELIGWLARRMPGESAHAVGVEEARESQRLMRAARRKTR
jgi:hypothetical protein